MSSTWVIDSYKQKAIIKDVFVLRGDHVAIDETVGKGGGKREKMYLVARYLGN